MIILKSLTQLDGKLSCKLYSKVNSVGIDKFSSSELQDDMDKQIINNKSINNLFTFTIYNFSNTKR
jgi:hypothetical protein